MTARELAIDILIAHRAREGFIGEMLDRRLRSAPLDPRDRGLLTNLVYGILRRRGSLDAILRPFISRPLAEVDPDVLDLLRLGAFQVAFLTNIPPHAAVYETVSLAQVVAPRAKGFVNGVLRRIVELLTADFVDAPARNALPFEAGRYRRLNDAILPHPERDPIAYLSDAMSWPMWLAKRWYDRHGWERCLQLGFRFVSPAEVWLRVNALWGTREQLLERFRAADIASEPGEHPQSLRLLDSPGVRDLPGYEEGAFTVQDESAMRVASQLGVQPGQTILDMCAAPGGKTTHLAELMGNQGRIIACDIDADRLNTVRTLAERLRMTCIETHQITDSSPIPTFEYDGVLVDVPCSNTGVLGRRPEVRWRLAPSEFRHLNRLQEALLSEACERVRLGGTVVYSTCSIEPDENRRIVRSVLGDRDDFELEAEQESFPGIGGDGGYWARLRKVGGE